MSDPTWRVIHGKCLNIMRGMDDGAADAIVCSPPYADQRDYELAAEGKVPTYAQTRSASRRQRSQAPWDFVEQFEPELREMLRVCSPEGSLMLNLGVIMRDGEEHGYADEILYRARKMGWKLLHRMIWHKPNSIPLSHPTYLHIKHEWVFWLAPTVDAYRGYDKETRSPHTETSLRRIDQPYFTRKDQRYYKRGATNPLHPDGARPATFYAGDTTDEDLEWYERWLDVALRVGVGGEQGIDHPAVMALSLALQLVSLSAPPGATVLDPYTGSGTTGIAALRRGRSFIGIEKVGKYAELARQRITDDAPLMNTIAEVA